MKHFILSILFFISAFSLHSQSVEDTVDNSIVIEYGYVKEGSKHYLVTTAVNTKDSTISITKIEKSSKKDAIKFSKEEIVRLESMQQKYNSEIDQLKNYKDQLIKELDNVDKKIKDSRTAKKLSIEGIKKLKKLKE